MECTGVQLIIVSIVLLGISTSLYSVSYTLYVATVCSFTLLLLTTVVAPEIIIPPNDTTVINGSEAVLNCTVVGNPLPSISWFVSGVDILLLMSNNLTIPFDEQGGIDIMVVESTNVNSTTIHSSLVLPETASFIAGDYTCRASNILGNDSANATLTVHGTYVYQFYGTKNLTVDN